MVPPRRVGRLLGPLAVLTAASAVGYFLFPLGMQGDAFFVGWLAVVLLLALVGGAAAWTSRTPVVWVTAILLTILSILGMWSIGIFVAPTALLLLVAALLLQLAGPREGVREAILADPPTVREAVVKTLAGVGSVIVGAGLVYAGAFAQELFGACASETFACAIEKTRWDAVGMTVLGLVALTVGGWLIWKQVFVARVIESDHAA